MRTRGEYPASSQRPAKAGLQLMLNDPGLWALDTEKTTMESITKYTNLATTADKRPRWEEGKLDLRRNPP